MTEILIHTGIYGILALAVINLFLVFVSFRRDYLSFFDCIWITLGIFSVSLISATVFFRNINRMHWLFYAAITVCLFGMIGLFLNLTQRLMSKNR